MSDLVFKSVCGDVDMLHLSTREGGKPLCEAWQEPINSVPIGTALEHSGEFCWCCVERLRRAFGFPRRPKESHWVDGPGSLRKGGHLELEIEPDVAPDP